MRESERLNPLTIAIAAQGAFLLMIWLITERQLEPFVGLVALSQGVLYWIGRRYKRLKWLLLALSFVLFFGVLFWITAQQYWLYPALVMLLLLLQASVAYGVFLYINNEQRHEIAVRIIKNSHQEWNENGNHWRFLMKKADFLLVNGIKADLVSKSGTLLLKEELAYLLRCAIQIGLEGQWGYWTTANSKNPATAFVLKNAFESEHLRVKLRAACILQVSPISERERILNNLYNDPRRITPLDQELISAIHSKNIVSYIQDLITNEQDVRTREKFLEVRDECTFFSSELTRYEQERNKYSLENHV